MTLCIHGHVPRSCDECRDEVRETFATGLDRRKPVIPDPTATPEEQGLTPGGERYPTPDPRLVEAMAGVLRRSIPSPMHDEAGHAEWATRHAAAILPGFLADPRTHEWLAEGLRAFPVPSSFEEWQAAVDRSYEADAAVILGREP